MSPDSIPHLSLGAALLAIFLVCLALVMLRGMARILTGSAIFALSGWVGLTTWHHSPELSYQLFQKQSATLLIGLPIVAFACTFFLLVKILRFVLTPFESFRSDDKPRTSIFTGLFTALIPTTVIFLLAAGLLHHFGSIEELRTYATGTDSPNRARSFLLSCKSSLDTILPASLMRRLDPITEPIRLQAAKLVTERTKSTPPPVIDPETGEPYPRAIIVDDPELQILARDKKFGTLMRHPLLTKAINDPTVQSLLKSMDR